MRAEKRSEFRRTRNSLAESFPIRQITGIITDPAGAHFSRANRREPDELQEFQWGSAGLIVLDFKLAWLSEAK